MNFQYILATARPLCLAAKWNRPFVDMVSNMFIGP